MSNLPKCRIGSNCNIALTLKDSGVSVDWSTVTIRQIFMYSVAQKAWGGKCKYHIDPNDDTLLKVTFPASQQMYMGDHRIVIQIAYQGNESTFDALAVNIVPLTEDVDDDVTIEAEDVEVGIVVSDLHTSVITEILEACQFATKEANEATVNANAAADRANESAAGADEAKAETIEATNKARAASLAATRATTNAEEATANANNAAEEARLAESDASQAAEEARIAGDTATEKAAYAKTQGDYAKTQGETARNRATEAYNAANEAYDQAEAAELAAASANTQADRAKAEADRAAGYNTRLESVEQKTEKLQQNTAFIERVDNKTIIDDDVLISSLGVPLSSGEFANVGVKLSDHSEKLTELEERVDDTSKAEEEMISTMDNLGDARAETLSIGDFPNVGVHPMILYAAGTPSASLVPVNWDSEIMGEWTGVPCFIGQQYINTSASANGLYYANSTTAVSGWKQA